MTRLPLAALVEVGDLVEVIWVSLVAGIGVVAIFSLLLYGGDRSQEARRVGRGGAAIGFGIFAVVAGLAFIAGLVFAVRLLVVR